MTTLCKISYGLTGPSGLTDGIDRLKITFIYLFIYKSWFLYFLLYSHLADCKQRVTRCVVPFMTHIRTKETKPVAVGQVQGYLLSLFVFCDTKRPGPTGSLNTTVSYLYTRRGLGSSYFYKCNLRIRNFQSVATS